MTKIVLTILALVAQGPSDLLSPYLANLVERVAESRAYEFINRPVCREHFKRIYKKDPVELWHQVKVVYVELGGPDKHDQLKLGRYYWGSSQLLISASLRDVTALCPTRARIDYIASTIVHELAHYADFASGGLGENNVPKGMEEGVYAEKQCECRTTMDAVIWLLTRSLAEVRDRPTNGGKR